MTSPATLAALAAKHGHILKVLDLGTSGVIGTCPCGMVARDLAGGVGATGSALVKRCPHAAK